MYVGQKALCRTTAASAYKYGELFTIVNLSDPYFACLRDINDVEINVRKHLLRRDFILEGDTVMFAPHELTAIARVIGFFTHLLVYREMLNRIKDHWRRQDELAKAASSKWEKLSTDELTLLGEALGHAGSRDALYAEVMNELARRGDPDPDGPQAPIVTRFEALRASDLESMINDRVPVPHEIGDCQRAYNLKRQAEDDETPL